VDLNLKKKAVNCCIRSWDLDTSEIWSKVPEKFWNVVLEKHGEYQMDRSC